jgi:hypothetical protein
MIVTTVEQLKMNGIPLGADLTKEQAQAIYCLGKEAVIFALLTQAKMIAEKEQQKPKPPKSDDPSCPSAQKPPYEKENKNGKKKKAGRKKGHLGTRRPKPEHIDHTETCRINRCPDCGSKLKQCSDWRDRYIEDIPEGIKVEVVRYIIYRDFCPHCRKIVEAPVEDALPRSTIGNRLLILSAWLHYCLGTTISQVLGVFNFHLHFEITAGGLVQMWHRLADILEPWYEEIGGDILQAGVLFGDETGWRVNGKTHWLWCFTTKLATLFTIDRSRAGPVVLKFIKDCFEGVLVSDFWGAYNILTCAKQKCLVHLLRDLERVEKYKNTSEDWALFSKRLKRLIRDAIRLRKRKQDLEATTYENRIRRIEKRLQLIIADDWTNKEAQRLIKRLKRHQQELFTFLGEADVPFDNNFAERMIRGAVIMRKNSFNNRSDKGARTQAILMSVLTTLKQRGLNPIDTLEKALRTYIKTGQLPKLADFSASVG